MSRGKAAWIIGAGMMVIVALSGFLRETPERPSSPLHRSRSSVASANDVVPTAACRAPLVRAASLPRTEAVGREDFPPPAVSGGLPDLASRRSIRHAEQDFWDDLATLSEARSIVEPSQYRQEVCALTAAYLGLDRSRAAMFDHVATQVMEEIGKAWRIRNEAIVSLPEGISASERANREQQVQEAYEADKTQATGRLEAFLENIPRHERFRTKLGEWIDALR